MDPTFEYLKQYGWPDWVKALFPLTVIFYKPSRPRERKRCIGWTMNRPGPAQPGKITWKRRYAHYKKQSTRDQNNFSYLTTCLLNADGYGTVRRSLRHKGYSKVIAMVYATPEEITRSENCSRYIFSKYKSVWEIYRTRGIFTPEMHDLIERLDHAHPSKASGQLRLW